MTKHLTILLLLLTALTSACRPQLAPPRAEIEITPIVAATVAPPTPPAPSPAPTVAPVTAPTTEPPTAPASPTTNVFDTPKGTAALTAETVLLYASPSDSADINAPWGLHAQPPLPPLDEPAFDTVYPELGRAESTYMYASSYRPQPSPNGRYLLVRGFEARTDFSQPPSTFLWLVDLQTGAWREPFDFAPTVSWSPHSNAFAYVRDGTLYTLDVTEDAEPVARLTDPNLDSTFEAWSPDGEWIAVVTVADVSGDAPAYEATVHAVSTTSDEVRALGTIPHGATMHAPEELSWSGNGEHVVFTNVVFGLDGSQAEIEGGDIVQDWFPQEPLLLASGLFGLAIRDTNLSSIARLPTDAVQPRQRAISPDGRRIAYAKEGDDGRQRLFVYERDAAITFQAAELPAGAREINVLRWNESGDALLLDDGWLNSPIWAVPALPGREATVVVENGMLLETMPLPHFNDAAQTASEPNGTGPADLPADLSAAVGPVVEAVLAGDAEAVQNLVQLTDVACTTAQGLGGPPSCAEGQAEGTVISVLPVSAQTGGYLTAENLPPQIANAGLYAIYRVPDNAMRNDYIPPGEYGLMFLRRDPPPATFTIFVTDGRIVRKSTNMDADPEQTLLQAVDGPNGGVLYRPAPAPTPTAVPAPTATVDPATETDPSTWVTERVEPLGFSIQHPLGWNVHGGGNQAFFESPQTYGEGPEPVRYSITVTRRAATTWQDFEADFAETYPDLSLEATEETVGERTAYRTTSVPSRSGTLTVAIPVRSNLYTVALMPYSEEPLWPEQARYVEIFEQMLATISFE